MSLNDQQKAQIQKLLDHRDSIVDNLANIQHILRHYFPEEFDIAYQHWIPQIVTALFDQDKWLPRGQQTFQDTINRLNDHIEPKNKIGQTVQKFI